MTTAERTLWIVDDDPGYRDLLQGVLSGPGRRTFCASSAEEALEGMGDNPPDLILLDMRMPGMGGLGLLRAVQAWPKLPPVLVLTAFAEIQDAVEAMKLGARDYLGKPVDLVDLAERVRHLLDEPAPATLDSQIAHPPLPGNVVAEAPIMRDLLWELQRVARSQAPVLLSGESGTGKEILAHLLHDWSERAAKPFMAINVTTLPESLVESELFGHAKGAFTGAHARKDGWIRAAEGGSLFLDEIAEMPLSIQPKLLRVLEEKQVTRVGENQADAVDFRLVSATHQDLQELVGQGKFRADLYYRLAVVVLEIPPLRERVEDILPLAKMFISQASQELKSLSPEAEQYLLQYGWPGNIRELRNAITRAAILSTGSLILPEHLPPTLSKQSPTGTGAALSMAPGQDLASLEKQAILESLQRNNGNRTQTALELGISRRKLLYRLKEYGESQEDRSLEG